MTQMRKISVIGLGLMGTPIATLLMKAEYQVTGFDIVKKQVSNLVPLGMKAANSPEEAVKGADLVILSLPNWNAVIEAVEGERGVVAGAQKGQIVIDTSTSPPWESMALGKRLAQRRIEWMDVPISGSSTQARVGNMVFMVGGKRSVYEKIKPVLDQIGKKTVYAGKSGDGATLKLVINHTLYLNQAAAIEGLVMGMKAGLNPDVLFDVITAGAASSDLLLSRGKDMLSGNFSPKGPVAIATKDLSLSLETAKRLGVVLPVGALYQQLLLKAHYNGWDREDATAVMKIYQELAGFPKKRKRISPK
ncbi:MAG TPA: NAD(P)-dependent oxidoreductase [Thermodesulfobacteriota bacterium]|nr:NAD(P)-dependent oxidoreductase [Thermodesulfobacteriota bacterium]